MGAIGRKVPGKRKKLVFSQPHLDLELGARKKNAKTAIGLMMDVFAAEQQHGTKTHHMDRREIELEINEYNLKLNRLKPKPKRGEIETAFRKRLMGLGNERIALERSIGELSTQKHTKILNDTIKGLEEKVQTIDAQIKSLKAVAQRNGFEIMPRRPMR